MRWRPMIVVLALMLVALGAASRASGVVPTRAHAAGNPPTETTKGTNVPPVLAYYYIWFNPTSWRRAKKDLPLLGPYSSSERGVMEQHIRWAKSAGIDGFLVSWKHTELLDYRLERLVEASREHGFKIGIVYQGLDFERRPLPAARVASDIAWLGQHYAGDPTLQLLGSRPLVMWSGTWKFTKEQIDEVSAAVRPAVTLLASERNPRDYRAVAEHFDGDAYYWASVNPATYPRYPEKLAELGKTVHEAGGIWIPPFAAGFDGRLVGGSSSVPRRGGQLVRTEWGAALRSSPDALGLISWNEFSENSHVEPSRNYGRKYLNVVADLTGSEGPRGELDSSGPSDSDSDLYSGAIAMGLFVLLGVVSLTVIARRRRRQEQEISRRDVRLRSGSRAGEDT